MQDHLIELSVGETIQIDEYSVTVVSIEGDQLCLEILDDEQNESGEVLPALEALLAAN